MHRSTAQSGHLWRTQPPHGAIDDDPRILPVPIDRAVDPLALSDGAGFGRARLVPTGEDGGNWPDEAVRRYLADECLGLRAHPTAAANFFPAARNNSPNWLRRPSSPQRLRADSTYDWMEDGKQGSA